MDYDFWHRIIANKPCLLLFIRKKLTCLLHAREDSVSRAFYYIII